MKKQFLTICPKCGTEYKFQWVEKDTVRKPCWKNCGEIVTFKKNKEKEN